MIEIFWFLFWWAPVKVWNFAGATQPHKKILSPTQIKLLVGVITDNAHKFLFHLALLSFHKKRKSSISFMSWSQPKLGTHLKNIVSIPFLHSWMYYIIHMPNSSWESDRYILINLCTRRVIQTGRLINILGYRPIRYGICMKVSIHGKSLKWGHLATGKGVLRYSIQGRKVDEREMRSSIALPLAA